ncbi:uncharacterized protein MEPE_03011 [Melanopsichium pennsylvanicum]|uniref:Uncharacterized protein n=2 Tax=Melanopsichium pennsylvanicum TaxID=63383 RepID=A0AAJ5C529_9BASI|nr:uncharacterized protein MEPE_03011 [Melanopsichium pennsylvanicum]
MTQQKTKGGPGFFAVLLGRGTTGPTVGAQTSDKRAPEESRTLSSNQTASVQGRIYAQARPSYVEESRIATRPTMSQERSRKDSRREGSATRPFRPHATADFDTIVAKEASMPIHRSKTAPRPIVSSMRPPPGDIFVDAQEAPDTQTSSRPERHSLRVSFNTPTHSLRKGKIGPASRFGEAGSSQDSFFSPSGTRSATKVTKPRYTSSASKAGVDERNWNSSTATLQNMAESRSQPRKNRRSKESGYPLASDANGDAFEAVRASGPNRVIIVPVSPSSAEDELGPAPSHYSTQPTLTPAIRRPGPAPIASYTSGSRRPSHGVQSRAGPGEVQRSRSQRDRRTTAADVETSAVRGSGSRSRSRPDKLAARASISTRASPDSVGVLSQNIVKKHSRDRTQRYPHHSANALHHDIGTTPTVQDRYSETRAKAQRA